MRGDRGVLWKREKYDQGVKWAEERKRVSDRGKRGDGKSEVIWQVSSREREDEDEESKWAEERKRVNKVKRRW